VKWINWVLFVFAFVFMLGASVDILYGVLGLWLVEMFVLVTLLERINDLEKDVTRKLSDYNSVIVTRINETNKKESPRKTVFKCKSCKFFAQDKYGRFCNAHMNLFRARCHKYQIKLR